MKGNAITANFRNGQFVHTDPLWQYDYGQVLRFTGVSLPETFEVHFSNAKEFGQAKTSIGTADGVLIPDEYLVTGKPVFAWIFLHVGEDDGETVYMAQIPVNKRSVPSDEAPTPQEQSAITQAIAALNSAVVDVQEAVEAADDARASAASAGASATAAAASEAGVAEDADRASAAATAAAGAQGAAEAAQAGAETAQTGAESARDEAAQASAAQIAQINATGAAVLESIPADYTELSADVGNLKSELTTDIPIININYKLQNNTNYTLETAINAVWDNFRGFCKKGAILVYKVSVTKWETRQFIVADNTITETLWKNQLYWKPFIHNSRQSIVVAAYDSTTEAKEGADFYTDTESYGIGLINQVIALLPNGGRIYLRNGTYKGSVGVGITASNLIIEGESLGVTIQRDSGNDVFANTEKHGTILKNLRMNQISFTSDSDYILDNCIIANALYKNGSNYPADSVYVPPEKGIDGINAEIVKMGSDGGTILLGEGVYTGSNCLSFYKSSSPTGYKSNIRIVGKGYNTVISRTSGYDCVANNGAIANNIIENVRFAHNVQRTVSNPIKTLRLISCWIGTTYINDASENALNRVNIGKGRFFDTYSKAYNIFTATSYPISPTDRWELHIYGHIVETEAVILSKGHIDLIGHNAVIELKGKGAVRFTFSDPSSDYYGYELGTVRNIHFLKTGCYNYYQNYCVYVTSDTVQFYDCVFENASSSPTPFDQRNYQESQEATAGARRHGIGIECKKWGAQCKTEFHDCIGIGSPYGFMNTRGWYIVFGSPKLFNCVGYGGGIGEFCHGIINHRSSQAELIGCIGYASKTAFRKSAGIRFQAAGSSQLTGCKGYGSGGTKYISEGVSAERVTEICTALGLDPSTYVVSGVVQYASLTDAICAEISNDDITLTPLNANTEEGYGISFWANDGTAKLMNCEGYVGSGDRSHGLHIIAQAKPTINGGYFGIKDMLQNINVVSNSENDMVTAIGGELNDYSKYTVSQITVSVIGGSVSTDDLLYVETTEDTPQTIVNGFNLKNISSIAIATTTRTTVAAGKKLKIYIKRNGDKIEIASGKYIMHVQYNYAGDDSSAVYIDNSADPLIANAVIRADDNNDAIEIGGSYTGSAVRMFDCALHGDVDADVPFASKTYVNSSSNYVI